MKLTSNLFNDASARFISVTLMMFMLISAPAAVLAADKDAHEDHTEMRIKHMHEKLKITSVQEEQWAKVEQAMREDAKTMDILTQARVDHAKELTAIDDLKSYGEIADAHAASIKKLTPLFTTLYENLSDEQKKAADALFRHGYHQHGDHKHGHKKLDDK